MITLEFLLYISPASRGIYELIARRVKISENAPICRKYQIFGWYQATTNTLAFCTQAIKEFGRVSHYVNETLLHESVHIAQACKANNGYLKPFWIPLNSMHLNSSRANDVSTATKVHGSGVKQIEHEAYWMEDKPNEVKYVLRKYCM